MFPTGSLLFLCSAAAASCTTQVEFLLLVFAEPQLDFFCFCFSWKLPQAYLKTAVAVVSNMTQEGQNKYMGVAVALYSLQHKGISHVNGNL